ncbi:LigA [Strigomonas culicis]|uniref:LigA n=1 Tax=Strigomonas culicis TaxID=28005 RepID=S9TGQ2_9TRYP|nr:LigA [Strigomonas culicis]|eukprot:EPY16074.1 LigA [Strigomonas culicis]
MATRVQRAAHGAARRQGQRGLRHGGREDLAGARLARGHRAVSRGRDTQRAGAHVLRERGGAATREALRRLRRLLRGVALRLQQGAARRRHGGERHGDGRSRIIQLPVKRHLDYLRGRRKDCGRRRAVAAARRWRRKRLEGEGDLCLRQHPLHIRRPQGRRGGGRRAAALPQPREAHLQHQARGAARRQVQHAGEHVLLGNEEAHRGRLPVGRGGGHGVQRGAEGGEPEGLDLRRLPVVARRYLPHQQCEAARAPRGGGVLQPMQPHAHGQRRGRHRRGRRRQRPLRVRRQRRAGVLFLHRHAL